MSELAGGVPEWVDIREVHRRSANGLTVFLQDALPAVKSPVESWVAYGIVVDVDGDGVADHRVGMDNAGLSGGRRGWGTYLPTGATLVGALDWNTFIGGFSGYGLEEDNLPDDSMSFRWLDPEPDMRFYAWASLIRDGRVVATDFAPDVGWIPVQP